MLSFTEALNSFKKNVKLHKSDIKDNFVQTVIKLYAEQEKKSVQEIESFFESEIRDRIEKLGNSVMSKNGRENMPESVAFDFLSKIDTKNIDFTEFGISGKDELLDKKIFFELTQYIIGENGQFFPLKNPFETKFTKPYFFITPDHLPLIKDPQLRNAAKNECTTAFCTPNAEMVFNREFHEKLALTSLIKGTKPKSKKYISNGGPIPDHYQNLELVILHELLHFSSGDHFYTKEMSDLIKKKHPEVAQFSNDILNFVGDFINNWQLVTSGLEQLPMGLFSEDINYDKFETYEDIIEAVIQDFKKMPPNEQQQMSQELQNQMNEHQGDQNDTPSKGGKDSEPSDKKQKGQSGGSGDSRDSGDGQDGSGDGQDDQDSGDQDGQSSDGQGDKSGKKKKIGSQDDKSDNIAKKIDDAMKENQKKLDKKEDGNDNAQVNLDKNETESGSPGKGNFSNSASGLEFKETRKLISWKKVLKKMIPRGDGTDEDTYSKMSRGSVSSMVSVQDTGTGRVIPGEIKIESDKKGLIFVIDNSGSVYNVLNNFNQEIMKLLKKHKKLLENMYIIKFSNSHEIYKVNVSDMTYEKVKDPASIHDKKVTYEKEEKIKKLFKHTPALGTEYRADLHDTVEGFHKKNYNIILFTDDDLVDERRLKKFFKLSKKRKYSIAAFITNESSLKAMEAAFGQHKWMVTLK